MQKVFNPDWIKHNPVASVQWVPVENVHANAWNPNAVASVELQLLYISIKADGITQPIVCYRAGEEGHFTVVDGFHRYTIFKRHKDIYELNHGFMPIVIIEKSTNELMASTIRHNRARGKHVIAGMSQLVLNLLESGWDHARVCRELGLDKEELIRLMHITGYAKFFEGKAYSPAMMSGKQIEEKLKYEQSGDDPA